MLTKSRLREKTLEYSRCEGSESREAACRKR